MNIIIRSIVLLSLLPSVALAQSNDAYWQQYVGIMQGQCAANVVAVVKQLDDAKKQIADLQKQLDEKHDKAPAR